MAVRLLVLGSLLEAALLVLVVRPFALTQFPAPSLDLQIVTIIGGGWQGLIWYVATWGILVALYGVALVIVRGGAVGREILVVSVFAALFPITVLFTYPATSADIFHYIMEGRIFFLHSANPLVLPPSAFPDDPFAAFASWPDSPAPYGPLWVLLMWIPHVVGADRTMPTLVAAKAIAVAFALLSSFLIYRIVRHLRPEHALRSALLFGWSPLVILNSAMDGHNDTAMIAFVLAGLFFIIQGRAVIGIPLLCLAAAVKAPALLALPPAILWQMRSGAPRRNFELLIGLSVGILLVAALYLPFWEGPRTFDSLRGEGSYFTASLGTVLFRAIDHVTAEDTAILATNLVLRGAFLVVYIGLLFSSKGRPEVLLRVCAWSFFAYLGLGAFWFMPWYTTWPLALAAASADRDALVPSLALSVTAMFNHAVFGFGAAVLGVSATSTEIEALATAVIWSLPLGAAVVIAYGRLKVCRSISAARTRI